MREFKGTKGKWVATRSLSNKFSIVSRTFNDSKEVCEIISNEEYEANALLISKAPEMLQMLQNILDNEYVSGQTYDEIKQLIKQATEI